MAGLLSRPSVLLGESRERERERKRGLASAKNGKHNAHNFSRSPREEFEVLVKAEQDFYREKWQKRIEREKVTSQVKSS
jgi:hypothetical protein